MCIACEMGFWIAMDDLPDGPPPGFPGYREPGDTPEGFACDAPGSEQPPSGAPQVEGERKSVSEKP